MYDALLVYLRQMQVDVGVIQETRWKFTGEWVAEGFVCFHSSLADCKQNMSKTSSSYGGVLTMIRTGLAPPTELRWACPFPGRLLHVRIPNMKQSIDIINVYQQAEISRGDAANQVAENRSALWHKLDATISAIPRRNVLIIAGDMNSHVLPTGSLVGPCVGFPPPTYADPEWSALVSAHELCLLNTWAQSSRYTSTGPVGGRSVVDYVAVRRQQADQLSRTVAFEEDHALLVGRLSYHVPLRVSISTHWQCWKFASRSPRPRLDLDKLEMDVACKNPAFESYLMDLHHALSSKTSMLDMDSTILEVVHRHYCAKPVRASLFPHHPMLSHIRHRWQLWRSLRMIKGLHVTALFRRWMLVCVMLRLQRRHRRAHREWRRQKLANSIRQARHAMLTGNQRALHCLLRALSPKTPKARMQLRDGKGHLLDLDSESNLVKNYMRLQFCDDSAVPLEPRWCSHLPFEEGELLASLRSTPAYKASPAHCPPALIIKNSAGIIAPILYHRLVLEWTESFAKIPDGWCTSWIHWIPKAGKAADQMSGWRGISLQSMIGKATLKAIVKRAMIFGKHQLQMDPQFAYLSGRSTHEAILRVIAHQTRTKTLGKNVAATHHELRLGSTRGELAGGMQLCLDIDGAFDKVDRQHLSRALLNLNLPPNIVALLLNWHLSTEYVSSKPGHPIHIKATRRVRQGCVAAPFIWLAYTHMIMHSLASTLSLQWLRDFFTMFADDCHACWEFTSEKEFSKALAQLRILLDKLMELGLRINFSKSVLLLHLRGTKASKWRSKLLRHNGDKCLFRICPTHADGTVLLLPMVRRHKYLGIMVTYGCSADATLRYRMGLAQNAFLRLRRWWSPSLPLHSRILLWQQVIWPTCTYGLPDVGVTKRGLTRLRGLLMRQIRWIARSPLHIFRESNAGLLLRLGMVDPPQKPACQTFLLWKRRFGQLAKLDSQDILHQVMLLGSVAHESSNIHSWYNLCVDQWNDLVDLRKLGHHPSASKLCNKLADDIPVLSKRLGVEKRLRAKQRADSPLLEEPERALVPFELHVHPPSSAPRTESQDSLTCQVCGQKFAHQMALRCHQHMHKLTADKVSFSVQNDSVDGMPTCRHCGMQFRYWLGLKQHIVNQVCQAAQDGRSQYSPSLPIAQQPRTLELAKQEQLDLLLDDGEICKLLRFHCIYCHKWIPRSHALSYHLNYSHNSAHHRGLRWFRNKCKSKALRVLVPCTWCGLQLAPRLTTRMGLTTTQE